MKNENLESLYELLIFIGFLLFVFGFGFSFATTVITIKVIGSDPETGLIMLITLVSIPITILGAFLFKVFLKKLEVLKNWK